MGKARSRASQRLRTRFASIDAVCFKTTIRPNRVCPSMLNSIQKSANAIYDEEYR